MKKILPVLALLFFCMGDALSQTKTLVADSVLFAGEKHFKNIRQLTFGGDNAEAYWSYDGKYLIFQRTNPKEGLNCDQIFIGKVPSKPGEKFTYKMIPAHPYPIGQNTAINTFGRSMTVMIFSWQICMGRS